VSGADSAAPIEEVAGASTNSTAQWCLNAMEVLAMCGIKRRICCNAGLQACVRFCPERVVEHPNES